MADPGTVAGYLNTGGPVLMPWLSRAAGVIEAWYPGEEDGTAIAALLYGDIDPSGRLPVTFPAAEGGTAIGTPAQWPGVDLRSDYTEGLDVDAIQHHHALGTLGPLFPFGFGLAYTHLCPGRIERRAVRLRGSRCRCMSATPVSVRGPMSRRRTSPIRRAPANPRLNWWPIQPVTLAPHGSKAPSLFVPWMSFRASDRPGRGPPPPPPACRRWRGPSSDLEI